MANVQMDCVVEMNLMSTNEQKNEIWQAFCSYDGVFGSMLAVRLARRDAKSLVGMPLVAGHVRQLAGEMGGL